MAAPKYKVVLDMKPPMSRICKRCGAKRWAPCTYTSAQNIHRDPESGDYVWNVVGEPTLRPHTGR